MIGLWVIDRIFAPGLSQKYESLFSKSSAHAILENMKDKKLHNDFPVLLRGKGLKATPGRELLLVLLAKESKPMKVAEIEKKLKGRIDPVTIYRALEALTETGLIHRVDFAHGHAHYEIAREGNHHHHLVCKKCGSVEDISVHNAQQFESHALKLSKKFAKIIDHSLEFFGLCKKCAKTTPIV